MFNNSKLHLDILKNAKWFISAIGELYQDDEKYPDNYINYSGYELIYK